ncbi:MAG: Gfo/Idh/MocA family oxidoreductase, partial [Victivallales bacterium]|nr:Gfo/Idh/MocA family oxidoreductase [Victivallales bacterium]
EKYAVPHHCQDYNEALDSDEVDCVAICTDHASHSPIAIAALDAGKHVLCEKALASCTSGLDAMINAHKACPDLVFAGVFQNRFTLAYQTLRQLVSEGAFGDMLSLSLHVICLRTREYYSADKWRGTWAKEGGSLMINQAIHFVDILNWVGGGIGSVSANFANLTHGDSIETEDTVSASLEFDKGFLGTISATSSSNVLNWDVTFFVTGTDASMEMRNGKVSRLVCRDTEAETRISARFETQDTLASPSSAKSYYGPSHRMVIANFIEAVLRRKPPFVSAADARQAVDVVLAIYKSHSEGRKVSLR